MSDKRKRAARAIQAETGMSYTAALREADRRHALAKSAADHGGERVVQWDEQRTRALLGLRDGS